MAPPFDRGSQWHRLHLIKYWNVDNVQRAAVRERSDFTLGQHTVRVAQICVTEQPDSAKTLADVS